MLRILFSSLLVVAAPSLVFSACSDSNSPSGSSGGSAGSAVGGEKPVGGESDGGASDAGASNGGTAPTAGAPDVGAAGVPNDAGSSSGGSSGSGGSGTGGSAVGTGSGCAYGVTGDITEPKTDAPYGCANGHIEQPNGEGDFTASIGAGFQDTAGKILALACTISSATPPAAGDTWTLSKDPHSQGNCQLNSTGTSATIWNATANDAVLAGSASITFKTATLTHGTVHPKDVYYLYDVTLTATLKGLTAGAKDVTVTGTLQNKALPVGS